MELYEFISTTVFDRQWEECGFTEDDRVRLESVLLENPDIAPVIPGTGGLRKMRFAFDGRGKSGSTRVVYVDFTFYGKIYLLTVYPKGKQSTLAEKQKKLLKAVVTSIKNELGGNKNERK